MGKLSEDKICDTVSCGKRFFPRTWNQLKCHDCVKAIKDNTESRMIAHGNKYGNFCSHGRYQSMIIGYLNATK